MDGNHDMPAANLIHRLFPPPPQSVRLAAEQVQIERLSRQVPNLYAVAMFNTLIIILALWHDHASWAELAIPFVLILFCATRIMMWVRRDVSKVTSNDAGRWLRQVSMAAASGVSVAALWCLWSLLTKATAYPMLGPISLSLGVICVAHCLAIVRIPAIIALVLGIYPTGIVMVLTGDQLSIILGLTFMTSALLQVRLVNEQYGVMINGLILEKKILDQANTDALTQLPNRRAFMEMLDAELASGAGFGLALLDLDGFKQVNDRLGHLAGDRLLQIIGERLDAHRGKDDVAARLGGDEFVVLMRGTDDPVVISTKATGIIVTLCQPAVVGSERIAVSASLGFAIHPRDGTTSTALLAAADVALYAAKFSGKAQAKAFESNEIAQQVA
ncbi:MAG: diguanylate cyclase domain-containing protein [Sphingomonadaceae bacterium]